MTKNNEQIIIDGCNVSGCEFYRNDNGVIAPDGTAERTELCYLTNDYCGNSPNCYFKQLKRKEQECEELKDKLNCRFCYPIMKIDDPENFKLCQETECFRRQLDQLKADNKHLNDLLNQALKDYDRILKTLAEVKEALQLYNNTTIGTDKGNGVFEFEVFNKNVLGGKLICHYDANPARKALRKINECEELKETIQLQNKMQMEVCEEKNTELDQLKAENEELKKQLESTKGLATVGNRQLAEALLELQKYKDKEQWEIELNKKRANSFKEMRKMLYGKFYGNSLIEKRSPYEN